MALHLINGLNKMQWKVFSTYSVKIDLFFKPLKKKNIYSWKTINKCKCNKYGCYYFILPIWFLEVQLHTVIQVIDFHQEALQWDRRVSSTSSIFFILFFYFLSLNFVPRLVRFWFYSINQHTRSTWPWMDPCFLFLFFFRGGGWEKLPWETFS